MHFHDTNSTLKGGRSQLGDPTQGFPIRANSSGQAHLVSIILGRIPTSVTVCHVGLLPI
jgi:hypothetical protein